MEVFCNEAVLTNICRINKSITIWTSGGETLINMVGYFRGYGWVWYDPQGITNILVELCIGVDGGLPIMFGSDMRPPWGIR